MPHNVSQNQCSGAAGAIERHNCSLNRFSVATIIECASLLCVLCVRGRRVQTVYKVDSKSVRHLVDADFFFASCNTQSNTGSSPYL